MATDSHGIQINTLFLVVKKMISKGNEFNKNMNASISNLKAEIGENVTF